MDQLLQSFLSYINQYGYATLLVIMLIEGSSLPFPGILLIISLSSTLKPSTAQIIIWALSMSVVYSISSLIPYAIGRLIEKGLCLRLEKTLRKAQAVFQKYGESSIALTRPFSLGNYIGYVAGISKVQPLKYFFLTFIGILPWCLTILYLSTIFGDAGQILHFLKSNISYPVLLIVLFSGLGYLVYRYLTFKKIDSYDHKETPLS